MTDNLKHKIIQYLNSEYGDLDQFEMEKYPGYIFFMKDGEFIFYYNKKNGYVGVSYKIWSFLESFFELKYKEIQVLTKEWVEEHYKLGVTTTPKHSTFFPFVVEKHYKLEVTTTRYVQLNKEYKVEEHYKLKTNDR